VDQPGATAIQPASERPGQGNTGGAAAVLNLLLIGLAANLDPLPLTPFLVILPSRR
jgi:hypothetical protein